MHLANDRGVPNYRDICSWIIEPGRLDKTSKITAHGDAHMSWVITGVGAHLPTEATPLCLVRTLPNSLRVRLQVDEIIFKYVRW